MFQIGLVVWVFSCLTLCLCIFSSMGRKDMHNSALYLLLKSFRQTTLISMKIELNFSSRTRQQHTQFSAKAFTSTTAQKPWTLTLQQ